MSLYFCTPTVYKERKRKRDEIWAIYVRGNHYYQYDMNTIYRDFLFQFSSHNMYGTFP